MNTNSIAASGGEEETAPVAIRKNTNKSGGSKSSKNSKGSKGSGSGGANGSLGGKDLKINIEDIEEESEKS